MQGSSVLVKKETLIVSRRWTPRKPRNLDQESFASIPGRHIDNSGVLAQANTKFANLTAKLQAQVRVWQARAFRFQFSRNTVGLRA